jgi:Ala-tRNA(Pro) deacylase
MPARKVKEFLDSHQTKYVAINHSPAYTAQEIAASAHIPGNQLAKTLVVKIDGRLAMAVLPGPRKLDRERLKQVSGAKDVELASELEFKDRFPECEVGAMPPFGNLYGMDVYVDKNLETDEIAFNAGSHTELIRMSYKDFERLVQPKIAQLSI